MSMTLVEFIEGFRGMDKNLNVVCYPDPNESNVVPVKYSPDIGEYVDGHLTFESDFTGDYEDSEVNAVCVN